MKHRHRFAGVVVCVALLFSSAVPARGEIYHSAPNGGKRIALTFDDGPHPSQTERILDNSPR